ncbi:hypothetical protein BZA05DRAFT_419173 [Tricharina praecox]|uniref:uncharacterized protein n=1 Tax=Tricharina praecox TaxID=43433 RepID=UPI0022201974|nr:uncharacterized protein BZA05DRAFT_419173 [Tricharina praecox]KAI5850656.1 hypothetical protein BZA05DRAFT_419173 [Tricharina praecox]
MAATSTTPDSALPPTPSEPSEPGGFLRTLSPPPSSPTPFTTALPTPSSIPLTAHATSKLIRHLDSELLSISRSHLNRYASEYSSLPSIQPLLTSLTQLVDLLWISSTPSLQTQYLLQIANSLNEYLPGYALGSPEEWRGVFALLDRLDRCFHALITRSVGGGGGAGLNMTEKVRLKSLVERTRLHVVKLLDTGTGDGEWAALDVPTESEGHVQFRGGDWDGAPPTPATTTATETDTETDDDMDVDEENEEEDLEWEIQVSRVYDRTLQEIGDDLISATS